MLTIKEFLQRADVQQELCYENLGKVYEIAQKDTEFNNSFESVGDLTQFFIDNDIDVFKYVDNLYPNMFTGTNIEQITVPSHITTIGYGAFSGCDNLRKVVIENGVKIIDDAVFSFCPKLKSVYIPDSVKTISVLVMPEEFEGEEVFYDSPNVTVYCSENSYAYKYACENNIPVKVLN